MTPDVKLRTHASVGCAPWDRKEINKGELRKEDESCNGYRERFEQTIEKAKDPTVVLFVQTRMFTDFLDGKKEIEFASPEWDATINGILDELSERSFAAGAKNLAIINMPCHERLNFGSDDAVTRSNDFEAVRHLNAVVAEWAKKNDAAIFDKNALLCPNETYYDSINSVPLYDDGLHYSKASAPIIWQWLAHNVRELNRAEG